MIIKGLNLIFFGQNSLVTIRIRKTRGLPFSVHRNYDDERDNGIYGYMSYWWLMHGASTGYSSRQSRQESPGTGRPGMRSRRGSKSRVRIIWSSSSTARAHSGTVACSMRSNCSGREAKVSPRSKLVTLRSSGMESLQKAAFCIRLLKNALFVAKKAVGRRGDSRSATTSVEIRQSKPS